MRSACVAARELAFTITSRTDPPRTVGVQMHDDGVTDDEPTPLTVRDRLTEAGCPPRGSRST
jgi:hypothetical protein